MLFFGDSKQGEKSVSMDKLYQSSFNPFKLYYDFSEDAWIGYIPSTFIIHPTLAEEPHPVFVQLDKGPKTSSAILSYVVDTFKQKQINFIETDFEITNTILSDTLVKYGFSLSDSDRLASRLAVTDVKLPDGYRDRENLEYQILAKGLDSQPSFLQLPHLFELESEMIEFLITKENISKSSLNTFFQYLKGHPDKIISQSILRKGVEIEGHALVVRTRWNKHTAILSFLEMKDPKDYLIKDLLIAKSLIDCQINGIDLLEVYIRDDVLLKESNYERYGFIFKNIHRYELSDK